MNETRRNYLFSSKPNTTSDELYNKKRRESRSKYTNFTATRCCSCAASEIAATKSVATERPATRVVATEIAATRYVGGTPKC